MPLTEFKLEFEICDAESVKKIPVIIVAAGSSVRMGGINKQFANISGVPVLARTLLAFENCPCISRIIVVTKEETMLPVQQLCEKYMIKKVSDIVPGGTSRHKSVLAGINRLSKDETKVLIHDGARPLVSGRIIKGVADALENHDAAACAVCVNDTVKLTDLNGSVEKTIDRRLVRLAQTPQGVDVSKYTDACGKVDAEALTDDASVMEEAGYSVVLTEGGISNIKITAKEDIRLAEYYISEENLCE